MILEHISKVEQYISAYIHIAHMHNVSALLKHRRRYRHICIVEEFV